MVQNKQEEVQVHEKKLFAEGESYKSSGWDGCEFNRALPFLFSFLDKNKQYSVLEIGSGGAALTKQIIKKDNLSITGLDLVYNILSKITSKRITTPLVNADIESLPFKDNSFNIIIHNQTLHHFPLIKQSLNEINRILKPKGLLMSIETNGLNPYIIYGHKASWKKRKRYISSNQTLFSIIRFKKELKKANFKILGIKLINHLPFKIEFLEKILQKIPVLRLFSAGSMIVCSQKI